ncbi:MAG: dehydrogenase [ubiquinone] 1 alpha subcomplex assembly factor 7 [Hyphomicrobiales bacterium]
MTPLEQEIRRIIALDGPMTISEYMRTCLGHPKYGYYVTRDPLGPLGDFTTAPEVSQMFGELLGAWAAAVWRQMGSPARLNLVELGPGRGTLMADALRAAKALPAFRAALAVHLVETSDVLAEKQRETLASSGLPVIWHRDVREIPESPTIFLANEFFDALPIHQAIRGEQGWHERVVALGQDNRLAFAVNPVSAMHFEKALPDAVRDAPVGAIYEWRSSAYALEIIHHIKSHGGAALIIDYGYAETRLGETLQGVRRHGYADPLSDPGEVDLTAHVDFGALAQAGRASGMSVNGPLTQGEFLHRLGIAQRATRLKANATPQQATDIDSALARLTAPGQMGELFKVLAIADPKLGAMPGFDS